MSIARSGRPYLGRYDQIFLPARVTGDLFSGIMRSSTSDLSQSLQSGHPRKRDDFVGEKLVGLVRDGRLNGGDKLPARPRLADVFGASRSSIRRTLRECPRPHLRGSCMIVIAAHNEPPAQLLDMLASKGRFAVHEGVVSPRCTTAFQGI
jgi:hypothetical protein